MSFHRRIRNGVALFTVFALVALMAACSRPKQEIQIEFAAVYGELPLACKSTQGGAALSDLRFFVYRVEVAGRPAELVDDALWQNGELALVDLEDSTDNCVSGTMRANNIVRVIVDAEQLRGLRFVVGVPEEYNHASPLTAKGPLSFSDMHWHWRSGYKFLRAGLRQGQSQFWLHLGSARCTGSLPEPTGCQASNRVIVDLANFEVGKHKVVIDIKQLFAGVGIAEGVDDSCSSGPIEAACRIPFSRLGLDLESGDMVSDTAVFRSGQR